ncbi:MAG: response regulator [Polaromonas sp.]
MHPDFSQAEELLNQELAPILLRALQRFRAILPVELDIALDLSDDHPRVRAHAQRLEDVLFSACILAWQSMAGVSTQIVVEMRDVMLDNVVLDHAAEKLQGGLPPRRYAWLVISNSSRTAIGPFHSLMPMPLLMDDRPSSAHRLKLVEMRNVIVQHKGTITASPAPAQGTAFDIYLPTVLPLEIPAVSGSGSNVKHVFYVDDYEAMRALVSEMLPDAGFRVTCYESGRNALSDLQADPMVCDAVVSDYKLMNYSGIELLRQIKLLRPGLPVIIISGYVDEALKVKAHDEGAALVMSKASDLGELCIALREVLGNAPNPALTTYTDWARL